MKLPPIGPALSPTPPAPSIVNLATWAWLPPPGPQELTGTLGGAIVDGNVVPVSMTLSTERMKPSIRLISRAHNFFG